MTENFRLSDHDTFVIPGIICLVTQRIFKILINPPNSDKIVNHELEQMRQQGLLTVKGAREKERLYSRSY